MLVLVWAGMIAGISFLEAPVKFTAPSVTLAIGLDIGRHVFSAFNKVEIVFGTTLVLIMFLGCLPLKIKMTGLLTVCVLLLECVWLLPVLDKRAIAIIAGEQPEGASPHAWYVAFEGIKLITLLLAGYLGVKSIIKLN